MNIVLMYVPCPSQSVAQTLVKMLLDEKLVACGNCIEAQSLYHWAGALVTESEWVLLLKTREALADAVAAHVTEHHPYTVPCIGRVSMRVNAAYGDWVAQQCLKTI